MKKNTLKQINSLKSSFKPQALLKNKFLLLDYEKACNNALTEFPEHSDYITLQKTWNTKVLEVLNSKINPESNIVSIGSFLGSAEIALAKSTHEIVCCDLESYLPKKLPNNVKFHQVNIDSNNLNLPERHFDICLCIELLEHLRYSPIPMLDWIKSNCNLLVISTPDDDEWPSGENKPWTTKAHFSDIPFAKKGDQGNPTPMNHCKQYSQYEFVELLHLMDFRIEEMCRIHIG
jgi:2-polyprenyl-3-methyl-5-hydroxy-6-metoxy-1,4-benzoquinol methylase